MDFCAPVDDAMDVSTASKNLPVTGSSSSPRASRTKPKLPDYDLYKVSGRDAFRILTEEIKYGKFASDVHSINKTFITQHQMEELWEDLVYLHHTRWLKEHMSIEGTVSSRVKAKKRNLGKAVAQVHGYKGFDADTYWKMQRVTQGLGSMSMDKDSQKSQSRRLNRRGKLEWKDGKPQWKLLKAEKEKARRAAALRMKTEDALSTFGELRLESKEGEIMKKRKPRQTKAERAAKHADFEARAQDKAKAEMDVTMSKGGDSQSDNWEDI